MNGQPVVPTALATNVPVLSSRQLAPFEYRILLGPLFPSDYARFFFLNYVYLQKENIFSLIRHLAVCLLPAYATSENISTLFVELENNDTEKIGIQLNL
jgi:hypothetical protein